MFCLAHIRFYFLACAKCDQVILSVKFVLNTISNTTFQLKQKHRVKGYTDDFVRRSANESGAGITCTAGLQNHNTRHWAGVSRQHVQTSTILKHQQIYGLSLTGQIRGTPIVIHCIFVSGITLPNVSRSGGYIVGRGKFFFLKFALVFLLTSHCVIKTMIFSYMHHKYIFIRLLPLDLIPAYTMQQF